MSDAALETLAVWLFVPAATILVILGFISYGISPRRARPGRREKQITSLKLEFQRFSADQSLPYVNWLDYKELTKSELVDIAAEYSWRYADQEITSTGWLVRFESSQDDAEHEERTG